MEYMQLIAGGRDFSDTARMVRHIEKLIQMRGRNVTIIEGDAKGADRIAGNVARQHGLKVEVFPADWDNIGRSAGFVRNQSMAERLKGHIDNGGLGSVVLFPGGRGTDHMRNTARRLGLMVFSPGM